MSEREPFLVLVAPELAEQMAAPDGYRIDQPCRMFLTPFEAGSYEHARYGATYEMTVRQVEREDEGER